jgi:hypothetical protein
VPWASAGFASAEEDGTDQQVALVDQPGLERVRRQVRPPTVRSPVAEALMSRTEARPK